MLGLLNRKSLASSGCMPWFRRSLTTERVDHPGQQYLPGSSLPRSSDRLFLALFVVDGGQKKISAGIWSITIFSFSVHARLSQAVTAPSCTGAGGQAYQNPMGYFPFYGMVRAGLPAWLIGVILGALHAIAL